MMMVQKQESRDLRELNRSHVSRGVVECRLEYGMLTPRISGQFKVGMKPRFNNV
jgi:hypothetical protein